MSITFGKWESSIHDEFEQVKRIETARKLSKKIVEIDKEKTYIKIQGSAGEPYTSTLDECDCMDFIHRKLPCKHIYCLAFERGEMEELPTYKKDKSVLDADREIERYKSLYKAGKITADSYTKICSALYKEFK